MKCVFVDVTLCDKKSGKKKDGSSWFWLKFTDGKISVSGFTNQDVFNLVDSSCSLDVASSVNYSFKDKCLTFYFEEVDNTDSLTYDV